MSEILFQALAEIAFWCQERNKPSTRKKIMLYIFCHSLARPFVSTYAMIFSAAIKEPNRPLSLRKLLDRRGRGHIAHAYNIYTHVCTHTSNMSRTWTVSQQSNIYVYNIHKPSDKCMIFEEEEGTREKLSCYHGFLLSSICSFFCRDSSFKYWI